MNFLNAVFGPTPTQQSQVQSDTLVKDLRDFADKAEALGPRVDKASGQSENKPVFDKMAETARNYADAEESARKNRNIAVGL